MSEQDEHDSSDRAHPPDSLPMADALPDDGMELADMLFMRPPEAQSGIVDLSVSSRLDSDPERAVDVNNGEDVERLVRLGIAAFGTSSSAPEKVRRDMIRKYLSVNTRIFQFMTVPGLGRVGYTSVIPLTEDAYQRHRDGELSQYAFSEENLEPEQILPSARRLYIQAFVVDPTRLGSLRKELKGSRAIRSLLLHHLARHIHLLNENPLQARPILIGEGFAERGRGMLDRFGFSQLGATRSATGNRIFVLDLEDSSKLSKAGRTTMQLLQYLVRRYV